MCLIVPVFLYGQNQQDEEKNTCKILDKPLESYQHELLDIAFNAASAMPVYPHIKNRSRAQEDVVITCLELREPELAHKYIEKIENWRRGSCYADLAFYFAHQGLKDETQKYLNLAIKISKETKDWRKDRIKVKISRVYAYLGQYDKAAEYEQDISVSESGKVAQISAMKSTKETFDKEIENIEKLISTKNFDIIKNALNAYAELYKRFYVDIERRTLVDEKIRASWGNIPISIRIDLLIEMAGISIKQKDQNKALELVNEAIAIKDSAVWQPRFGIPVKARLAKLCFLAGDKERAKKQIQDALDMFDAKRGEIVNIYRAGILRSIAETYQAMDNTNAASDIYKRALEAGMENPNSRPRAEDLVATCCSMALHEMKPDVELLNRIREIRDGLGDPW
jgi:tetratricopeptide (TPR) repeat protein